MPPARSPRPSPRRIEPLEAFFVAESYHHNYAELNPGQGYIQFVSMPKVGKLESYFGERLKDRLDAQYAGTQRCAGDDDAERQRGLECWQANSGHRPWSRP